MGLSLLGAETPFIISTLPACACGSLSLAQSWSHKVAHAYFTNAGEPAQTWERFPATLWERSARSSAVETPAFTFFFWQVASPTTRGKRLITSSGMYRQPDPTWYPDQINPLVVLPPPHAYPLPVFLRSGATQRYTGEFCPQRDPQMYVQPCYVQTVASWSDCGLRTHFQGLFFGKLYHLVQALEYDVIFILLFSSGHQMY